MIEVRDLYKSYVKGTVKALIDISFSVEKGEVFGLIGPDGSGKSSLFRILASLILPDSGSATIHGYDVVRDINHVRKIIGYMPGQFSLYQDLTVKENLKFFATLFNTSIKDNYYLIKNIYTQIAPFEKRRAGALSGGMKQKLALCCALIHKPEVLLLDEPTTGVDPVSRKEFWDMLVRLQQEGITILVSTAYMDEASRCGRIALIREGEFIATDTPKGIINSYKEILWSVEGDNMYGLLTTLRHHPSIKSCFAFGNRLHITVSHGISIEELGKFLLMKGFYGCSIRPIIPTIEDCFMAGVAKEGK